MVCRNTEHTSNEKRKLDMITGDEPFRENTAAVAKITCIFQSATTLPPLTEFM